MNWISDDYENDRSGLPWPALVVFFLALLAFALTLFNHYHRSDPPEWRIYEDVQDLRPDKTQLQQL